MMNRIAIAVPGIAIAIGLVVLGGPTFGAAVAIVALLGLLELRSLVAEYRPLRWASDAGALACVLLPLVGDSPLRQLVAGTVVVLLLGAVAGLIAVNREEITLRVAVTIASALYVGLPLGCLVAMRQLPDLPEAGGGVVAVGAGAVANALVATWSFDTASYFGGRAWGRRPLAPRTSPNKTVEGAIVGLVGAVVATCVAGLYMPWLSWWESALLGAATCLAALIGDLFESMLKRDAGVKDSGRLLGEHGGILDRFDALLFAAPVSYLITLVLLSTP